MFHHIYGNLYQARLMANIEDTIHLQGCLLIARVPAQCIKNLVMDG